MYTLGSTGKRWLRKGSRAALVLGGNWVRVFFLVSTPGEIKASNRPTKSHKPEGEVEEPEFRHKPQLDSRCCHKRGWRIKEFERGYQGTQEKAGAGIDLDDSSRGVLKFGLGRL